MKKLIYFFIFLFWPFILSAQQTNDLRTPVFSEASRDSLLKELLPNAENWRLAYNNRGMDQLSTFSFEKPGKNSPNANEFSIYSANFQKDINEGGSVDSVLIFTLNLTCDEAILFSKKTGKASSQKVDNLNILSWKKTYGEWRTVTHYEAIAD